MNFSFSPYVSQCQPVLSTYITSTHECTGMCIRAVFSFDILDQCFSNAGPRPGTGSWQQLYRVVRGSPGICHFSFLRNFHE